MHTMRSSRPLFRAALLAGLVLVAFAVLVLPAALRADSATNALTNGDFESGVASWTCKSCTLSAGAPAHGGAAAGQLVTTNRRAIGQLWQKNLTLQPNTEYQLTFWAKSSGRDLQVDLQKGLSPFTNYGLNRSFDVTTEWQQFTATFVTTRFDQAVTDARLRFRTPKGKGITYSLDDVSLIAIGAPPTPTPSPTPSVTPETGSELVVFDWNQPVTQADHGFPWDKPPMPSANGNWMTPVNFAEGTLYLRAEIISIPVNQDDMRVQFCIWQDSNKLENCTRTVNAPARAGTVVEWSVEVQKLWKKDGAIIDWSRPRHRNGIAIKNGSGDPVSDYSGWHWNGENPADWYPMNARFTVVVVEKGKNFSGWDNYIP